MNRHRGIQLVGSAVLVGSACGLLARFGERDARHAVTEVGAPGLVIAHSLQGALEPCGCGSSKSGGGGGRLEAVARIRIDDPGAIVVEGGNWLTGGKGPWDNVAIDAAIDLFREERTAIVCVGDAELPRLSELADKGLPLALLIVPASHEALCPRWRQVGPYFVTGLIDTELSRDGSPALDDPEPHLSSLENAIQQDGGMGIVFVHAYGRARSRWLQRLSLSPVPILCVDVPGFNATAGGYSMTRRGMSLRMEWYGKEMAYLRLRSHTGPISRLVDDAWSDASPDEPGAARASLRIDAVPLGEEGEARAWLGRYRHGLLSRVDHSGRAYEGFAGSHACVECHALEAERWRATPHAIAMESLRKIGKQDRADCYACHVTADLTLVPPGLLPGPASSPSLAAVGCESCHGPAALHAKNPQANRLANPTVGTCTKCHFGKHDPTFDFAHMLPMATCQPSDAPVKRMPYFGEAPVEAGPTERVGAR